MKKYDRKLTGSRLVITNPLVWSWVLETMIPQGKSLTQFRASLMACQKGDDVVINRSSMLIESNLKALLDAIKDMAD